MTVFVVHEPLRRNEETGQMERAIDVTPAAEFGALHFLLPPGRPPSDLRDAVDQIREQLNDFGDGDYILPVGNPALIGATIGIAAFVNDGRVKVLQWQGRNRCYYAVDLELWDVNDY